MSGKKAETTIEAAEINSERPGPTMGQKLGVHLVTPESELIDAATKAKPEAKADLAEIVNHNSRARVGSQERKKLHNPNS